MKREVGRNGKFWRDREGKFAKQSTRENRQSKRRNLKEDKFEKNERRLF